MRSQNEIRMRMRTQVGVRSKNALLYLCFLGQCSWPSVVYLYFPGHLVLSSQHTNFIFLFLFLPCFIVPVILAVIIIFRDLPSLFPFWIQHRSSYSLSNCLITVIYSMLCSKKVAAGVWFLTAMLELHSMRAWAWALTKEGAKVHLLRTRTKNAILLGALWDVNNLSQREHSF